MYSMLYDANFTYDSSMPIYEELYNSCNNAHSARAKLFSSVLSVTLRYRHCLLSYSFYSNGIWGFTRGLNVALLNQDKA